MCVTLIIYLDVLHVSCYQNNCYNKYFLFHDYKYFRVWFYRFSAITSYLFIFLKTIFMGDHAFAKVFTKVIIYIYIYIVCKILKLIYMLAPPNLQFLQNGLIFYKIVTLIVINYKSNDYNTQFSDCICFALVFCKLLLLYNKVFKS